MCMCITQLRAELAGSFVEVVALAIDAALAVLTRHVGVVLPAPAVDELEPKLAWLGVGAGLGLGLRLGLRLRLGLGLGLGLGLA